MIHPKELSFNDLHIDTTCTFATKILRLWHFVQNILRIYTVLTCTLFTIKTNIKLDKIIITTDYSFSHIY